MKEHDAPRLLKRVPCGICTRDSHRDMRKRHRTPRAA